MSDSESVVQGRWALVVVDQVPAVAFDKLIEPVREYVKADQPVSLGYIPRTTPCGHATISTGRQPAEHRVQGREWVSYEQEGAKTHDIDMLPRGEFDPALSAMFREMAFASAHRRARPGSPLVIVAAKAFIPYLFGAQDADVVVFPQDTKPRWVEELTAYALVIRFEAFSGRGRDVLRAAERPLFNLVHQILVGTLGGSALQQRRKDGELLLFWVMPQHWTRSGRRQAMRKWFQFLAAHATDVDHLYRRIGTELLAKLEQSARREGTLVQSWFSTDLHGHFSGCESEPYVHALSQAARGSTSSYEKASPSS